MAGHDEQAIESEIQAKGKTAPRITPQMIDDTIYAEYSFSLYDALVALGIPAVEDTKVMTISALVLKNRFLVIGESACASPENYDAEIGRKISRDNARNKIWPLEGYRLRSELATLAKIAD